MIGWTARPMTPLPVPEVPKTIGALPAPAGALPGAGPDPPVAGAAPGDPPAPGAGEEAAAAGAFPVDRSPAELSAGALLVAPPGPGRVAAVRPPVVLGPPGGPPTSGPPTPGPAAPPAAPAAAAVSLLADPGPLPGDVPPLAPAPAEDAAAEGRERSPPVAESRPGSTREPQPVTMTAAVSAARARRRYDPNEAAAEGGLGVPRLAEQQEAQRLLPADEAGEVIAHAVVATQRHGPERGREAGRHRRQPEVGGQGQAEPGAGRWPVHRRHSGLGHLPEERGRPLPGDALLHVAEPAGHELQIPAGAKGAAPAGEYDRPDGDVAGRPLELRREPVEQLPVESVAALGPVQGQRPDGPPIGDFEAAQEGSDRPGPAHRCSSRTTG